MEGYTPYEMQLEKKLSGWVWGNIAFGGVVGVIVDGTTGAMYRLTPNNVDASMNTYGHGGRTADHPGRHRDDAGPGLGADRPAHPRMSGT